MEADKASAYTDTRFALLRRIVAHAFEHEDPQALLEWAQRVLPQEFAEVLDDPEPVVNARASYWIARVAWNGTPLASNGYLPKPLPAPEPEAPCPCGTAVSFSECCMPYQNLDIPAPSNIWLVMATIRSDAYWLREARAGKLPAVGVCLLVAACHERQRWKPLEKLGEIALSASQSCTPAQILSLIDWLYDAYDNLYRTQRKKRHKKLALLKPLATHETPAVRAAANRRLATLMAGVGDMDAAKAAMNEMRRAEPNSITTAMFEVATLIGAGDLKRASELAAHWREHFQDDDDVAESDLETLDTLANDPRHVLEDLLAKDCPPQVWALLDWIDRKIDRPLPRLRWNALGATAEDATLRDAYQPVTGRNRRMFEDEWQAVSGMKKPDGTQPFSGVEPECWERCTEWVVWLRDHTQALDSVTILDDLVTLLDVARRRIGVRNRWRTALLTRGLGIVEKHWPPERTGTLPWALEANRPALRLLVAFINNKLGDWEDGRLESAIRLYMRLNPDDTHRNRSHLVERLLTVGRDSEALACAERYPDDKFAQTRYGAVLALYRLGRLDEAEEQLEKALVDLPLVPKYLLPERIRRPRSTRRATKIGGKVQAWHYRDDMREVWMSTDGALEWLSEQTNKSDPQGGRRPRISSSA